MAATMESQVKAVMDAVAGSGITDSQSRAVEAAVRAHLPKRTYNLAVVFLGLTTIALAVGAMVIGGFGGQVPEPLWAILGSGIGGLAGIFMGNQ